MLLSHIESSLLHRAPWSRLLLVVNVEANLNVWINVESLLDHLSYPENGVWLRSISQPDCKLVSLASNIDYSTIHLGEEIKFKKMIDKKLKYHSFKTQVHKY